MGKDIIYNILVVIIVLCVLCVFFGRLILVFIIRHTNTETQKCKKCKGVMTAVESLLYLIPVHFDDEHEESAKYYIQNAKPIADDSQIPSGNRACYLHVFQCQDCGYKNISIVDFLKVREKEMIKGGEIYPYEEFEHFIRNRYIKEEQDVC